MTNQGVSQECKDGFVVKLLLIYLAIFHLKEKTVSPSPKLLENYLVVFNTYF